MPGVSYLADTNILLRLVKSNDPEFLVVRSAVRALKARGERLCFIPQNIVEFWNVCTRRSDRNGYGLSPREADERAHESSAPSPCYRTTNSFILSGGDWSWLTRSLERRCTTLGWSPRCTSTGSHTCLP